TATVTVRASSVFNPDDLVEDSFNVAVAGVPTAPAITSMVAGNAQTPVAWTASTSPSSALVANYLVKYSSNGGATWTNFVRPASTATACTVTGLTNGLQYVFKVVAQNSVGLSLPSANSAPATPATVPSIPTAVVAVRGNASLAVSWATPAATGGSPITDYLVKYSSSTGTVKTWTTFVRPASTATACTVTGLTNGLPYVFKVIARNAAGISLPSANSALATPATVPGNPTAVVAVRGNTQLVISWLAPLSTGGSPITDYLVKYSSSTGTVKTWTTFVRPASTATSVIVTSLTNGLPYVFKVIARNAAGISLPSANSLAVAPALPSA
ncbi:MAG: fibronectin type III domain-containing protein, partial [Planctomycetia bacterium]|nr:fibronectin type III domain-containing protein [Planctomycetia bacterium]